LHDPSRQEANTLDQVCRGDFSPKATVTRQSCANIELIFALRFSLRLRRADRATSLRAC
jgi:hypothetical protein